MIATIFENLKHLAEALAIVGGGFALAIWAWRGAFVPSIRSKLDVVRKSDRTKPGNDTLNVTLSLENSGRASISLEQVRIRVLDGTHGHEEEKAIPVVRCDFKQDRDANHDPWNPSGARPINLAKSDSTHLGCVFTTSANSACVVEAVIIGSNPFPIPFGFRRTGLQWRVSAAVLPVKADEQTDEREPE